MITRYLSELWMGMAPGLADHLWQSTLFTIAAGLLTLTLRKNRAGARYWLWLAASAKFLVPFSLLAAIGSRMNWMRAPEATNARTYLAIEEISRPFTQPAAAVRATTANVPLDHLLPIVAGVWLAGFLAVLLFWYARWRRVSVAIKQSEPLVEGREWEALRRVENSGGLRTRIEMLMSRASLEPGIFGIVKPVMVWPQGISARLDDAHMEAILAHELWHVRRRDNLAAAVHMVVEAIFWFHPLVWWLGARLVEERERACDEEVLEFGSERQIYAESILKVCEFCVGSPLACVAGVTGADLKKRIVHIMTKNVVRKLNFSKKLLLSVAGLMAVALPIVFGVLHATPSRAEALANGTGQYRYKVMKFAASKTSSKTQMIKMLFTPEGFSASGVTVQGFLKTAYKLEDNQISGAPDWVNSAKFDVEATIDESTANELKKIEPEQRGLVAQRMLQTFLTDQFKLKVHGETKELPIYSLVVAPGGAKLQEAKPGSTSAIGIKGPDGQTHPGMMRLGPGSMEGQAITMSEIADLLSRQVGTKVVDKTGFTGRYDVSLNWTGDESQPSPVDNGKSPEPPAPFSGPALLKAIQEQLGLELEPLRAQVQILAIDQVEKPPGN